MKKDLALYYLITHLLLSITAGVRSQDLYTASGGERVLVLTDRTVYISGENIRFSAIIIQEGNMLTDRFSRIIYCELITPGGQKVTGGKYLVENSSGHGCLQIPEETISGMYYLQSYTRFMRNGSPEHYHYILLKIINPYKSEVLSGQHADDTLITPGPEMYPPDHELSLGILQGKDSYSPREQVDLKITSKISSKLETKLCLSVIPALSFDAKTLKKIPAPFYKNNVQYFPETRGISLTGRLLNNETGLAVPGALVNLSIIGDRDFMAVRTESSGQFFFALPDYTGKRDIFLCAEDIPGNLPGIYIDNDFCSRPVNLPSPAFSITEKEEKTLYGMAVNRQIASIFFIDSLSNEVKPKPNGKPFYGEPTEILIMEDYIELPTLEEYFNEIPVAAKVRKSQGRKEFRFYTTQAEMNIYDPLVLVDWVAVDDIDRVLAMPPGEIERIELVNAPYIKGNITYGGIISFVSKYNDFAGIDLPVSGTFINYDFLQECKEELAQGSIPENLPDARNTVFWDPDLKTDTAGHAEISFPAPDTPGTYLILLRGMLSTGEIIIATEEIEVTKDR